MFLSNEQSSVYGNLSTEQLSALVDADITQFFEETTNIELAFIRFEHKMIVENTTFMIEEGVGDLFKRVFGYIKSLFEKVINKIRSIFTKKKSDTPSSIEVSEAKKTASENKKNKGKEPPKEDNTTPEPASTTDTANSNSPSEEEKKKKKKKKKTSQPSGQITFKTKYDYSKADSFTKRISTDLSDGKTRLTGIIKAGKKKMQAEGDKAVNSNQSIISTKYIGLLQRQNVTPRFTEAKELFYSPELVDSADKVIKMFDGTGNNIIKTLDDTKNEINQMVGTKPEEGADALKAARPAIASFLRNTVYLTSVLIGLRDNAVSLIRLGA
jgi:hypothetical protein